MCRSAAATSSRSATRSAVQRQPDGRYRPCRARPSTPRSCCDPWPALPAAWPAPTDVRRPPASRSTCSGRSIRRRAEIEVVGAATTDAYGGYRIDKVPMGSYEVSAFHSDFSDGNVSKVVLKFHQQVFKADIKFRGGGGRVFGVVYDDDGQTPLKARVGISGDPLVVAGGQVGVGFEYVQNFKIVDTNFTTGRYFGRRRSGSAASRCGPSASSARTRSRSKGSIPAPDEIGRDQPAAPVDEPHRRHRVPARRRDAGRRQRGRHLQVGCVQGVLLGEQIRRRDLHDDSTGHPVAERGDRRGWPVFHPDRQRRQLHVDAWKIRRAGKSASSVAR